MRPLGHSDSFRFAEPWRAVSATPKKSTVFQQLSEAARLHLSPQASLSVELISGLSWSCVQPDLDEGSLRERGP